MGLIGPGCVSKEEFILYKNTGKFVFTKHIISSENLSETRTNKLDKERVKELFALLEQLCYEWTGNYNQLAMDGSTWELRLRTNINTVIRVCGENMYPPNGEWIDYMIRSLLQDANCMTKPKLFGCSNCYIDEDFEE
jgi:hypothetical protein